MRAVMRLSKRYRAKAQGDREICPKITWLARAAGKDDVEDWASGDWRDRGRGEDQGDLRGCCCDVLRLGSRGVDLRAPLRAEILRRLCPAELRPKHTSPTPEAPQRPDPSFSGFSRSTSSLGTLQPKHMTLAAGRLGLGVSFSRSTSELQPKHKRASAEAQVSFSRSTSELQPKHKRAQTHDTPPHAQATPRGQSFALGLRHGVRTGMRERDGGRGEGGL